jgi:molybdenum cofactor cytidylyltransferase
MGTAKQALEFQGQSLLRRAVSTALACQCRPIVVVLGSRAQELAQQAQGMNVTVVVNDNWPAGMGSSIRAGMSGIGAVDAVVIFLCDQPLVTSQSLDRLVATHFESGQKITAATYAGVVGTPVVFSGSLFDDLRTLPDAQGGKAILARYPEAIHQFPLEEAEVDVDTIADFERLCNRDSHQSS